MKVKKLIIVLAPIGILFVVICAVDKTIFSTKTKEYNSGILDM